MIRFRHVLAIASLALLAPFGPAQAVNTATANLIALDKNTSTGWLDARVELYAPPDAKGNLGAPKVYPAQLLFARPGQFRLVLRTGAKNEYRAASNGSVVTWMDYGTGIGGQQKYADVVDPFTQAMLGVAGAITRFTAAKEIAMSANSPLRGARLATKVYGSSVVSSKAWFSNDKLIGFEFLFADNSRVFVSVLSMKQNVPTKPSDFVL
ncbi:MAG: hypothetical protein E6Q88_10540 [Lysobacteraceae bacterium]|nr:MAG: hypothetical protein E6Q88_10540 [Xanthomonadaceae bacterium]